MFSSEIGIHLSYAAKIAVTITLLLIGIAFAYIKRSITRLKTALEEIRTLSGLLPICAGCKKIRNDSGYWQEVEEYVEAHSEIAFSHGLCPNCMERYLPEYSQILEKKKQEAGESGSD
jgi:hypothetical protein